MNSAPILSAMSSPESEATTLPAVVNEAAARELVARAVGRWAVGARGRVPHFVDRHFTARGSFRLHRSALGLDLLRAPANVVLGVATAGTRLAGHAAALAGARGLAGNLRRRTWFLETDVGRALLFHVHDELLRLPVEVGGRRAEGDALLDEIMADPLVRVHLGQALVAIGLHADDQNFQDRLRETLISYVGSRTAATELAANLSFAATGFLAYHKLTPGVVSLAAPMSASLAHAVAVSHFWAGPSLGGLWYGIAGAPAAGAALTGAVALGLSVPVAMLTAFAGVVTDPIQRQLGWHSRKLTRLVNVTEQQFLGDDAAALDLRDHYVARVFDVLDIATVCWRLAAGR